MSESGVGASVGSKMVSPMPRHAFPPYARFLNVGDPDGDGLAHVAKTGDAWGEGIYSSTMPAVAAG